jgi:hypothetical protein
MRTTSTVRASRRRTSADAGRHLRRLREAVGRRDVGFALLVAAAASAFAGLALRLWRADLRIPFDYSGDTLFNLMAVKGVLEHGGYNENPSLGAPFGQDLYDLAMASDRLNLWLIEGLGFLSSDPAAVMNLFYLLTFPLTALSAFLCLRLLGASAGVSTVCSLLYSLLPYHFWRGEDHLLLSAYYSVPLAAYLIVSVLAGNRVFVRRGGNARGITAYASGRSLLALAFCVVVGSTGVYYAAFTIALVIAAALLALVARRDGRALATGAVLVAIITATVAANLYPTIRHELENGRNDSITRTPQESELFSLVPIALILPRDDHRIGFLADRTRRYSKSTLLRSEGGQSLGTVATVGLVWLLAVGLLATMMPRRRVADQLTRHLAVLVLVAILVGTIGGLSSLVAYLVTPQLRAWNRISIFIAFFCLVAVALLLERARNSFRSRGWGRTAFAGLLAAILAVGALDQTSDRSIPAYGVLEQEYRNDAAFARAIETRLPPGASVFQLPHVPFPEAPPFWRLDVYDPLRGYLHSRDLRWSYGAMKGRPEDWAAELGAKPLSLVLPAVAASGFEGIYVDRFAYADNGQATKAEIARIVRSDPLVGASGRAYFFDLRAYARRLRLTHTASDLSALRQVTLEPVIVSERGGFSPLGRDGVTASRDGGQEAELELVNPSNTPRDVVIAASLESTSRIATDVTISFGDGISRRLTATRSGTPFNLSLNLQPGPNVVRFTLDLPPPPAPRPPPGFRLVSFRVIEQAHEPFLDAGALSEAAVLNLG